MTGTKPFDEWCTDTDTEAHYPPTVTDDSKCCTERGPSGYWCTLTDGHDGRHIASGTKELIAAWPGTGRPTPEELKTWCTP